VDVSILGPFKVARSGADVTPSAPKLRRVLALLAVQANRVVSIDQIIQELWDERPPPSATTTMQTYVYQVRKVTRQYDQAGRDLGADDPDGSGMLHTTFGGYMLTLRPEALDALRFEQLVEKGRGQLAAGELTTAAWTFRLALQQWKGPALTAVNTGPVLQAAAVRLEEMRKSVLEQRIDIDLQLGRHHDLISELISTVSEQPTHEGFQAKLMLALYRVGRRSEALQTYQRARAALHDELGLEPSTELRRLQKAILDNDGFAGAATPPNMLPPDVAVQVGRDQELAAATELLTRADRTTAPVIVVAGAPGIGKSAFAVHLAHKVRASYPDGQLHHRLTDDDGTAQPPAEVLAELLRAIGVAPEKIPPTVAARSQLLRSWTANRRVLIVLDDAAGIDQVLPLLPIGAGCATVVASRRRIAGPAISMTVDLPPLAIEDATQLLTTVLGAQRLAADPEGTGRLLTLCAGLPLALREAATRLSLRTHWLIGRQVDRMRVGDTEITDSMLRSHRLLPPGARRVFLVLVDSDAGAITAAAVAALTGMDEATAESYLEDLVEFLLADAQRQADGTFVYRTHALYRAAAAVLDDSARNLPTTPSPYTGTHDRLPLHQLRT
jgi:DNA-binding SARP family transcriptional activator